MPATYAAIWSAVAATCSALTAILVMLIQRRNLIESVRADLIPLDWTRSEEGQGESEYEIIRFNKIRNVGRGPAFNVSIGSKHTITEGDRPKAIVMTIRIPVIGPNESIDIEGDTYIWWKNVEPVDGHKYHQICLSIQFTDARDVLHTTEFKAFIAPLDGTFIVKDDLAPRMQWVSRTTDRKPLWRLKLANRTQIKWQSMRTKWQRMREEILSGSNKP